MSFMNITRHTYHRYW